MRADRRLKVNQPSHNFPKALNFRKVFPSPQILPLANIFIPAAHVCQSLKRPFMSKIVFDFAIEAVFCLLGGRIKIIRDGQIPVKKIKFLSPLHRPFTDPIETLYRPYTDRHSGQSPASSPSDPNLLPARSPSSPYHRARCIY